MENGSRRIYDKFMIRDQVIVIRVNLYEKNRIKGLARLYANGDVSAWLRHGGMTADRKQIKSRKPPKKPAAKE